MMPYVSRRTPRRLERFVPVLLAVPPLIVASQYVSTHALPGGARSWLLGSFTFGLLLALVRLLLGSISKDPRCGALRLISATWFAYGVALAIAFAVQLFQLLVGVRGQVLAPWELLAQLSLPVPSAAAFFLLVPLLAGWLYTFYQSRARSFNAAAWGTGFMAVGLGTAPVWLYLAMNTLSLATPIHLLGVDELRSLARGIGAILAAGSCLGACLVAVDLLRSFSQRRTGRWTA